MTVSPPMPLVTPPPPPSGFARLWRILLPVGLGVIAVALLFGVFDSSSRPAWIFVIGAVITAVGVVSLILFLVAKSRQGIAVIEAEIEEHLGGDDRP